MHSFVHRTTSLCCFEMKIWRRIHETDVALTVAMIMSYNILIRYIFKSILFSPLILFLETVGSCIDYRYPRNMMKKNIIIPFGWKTFFIFPALRSQIYKVRKSSKPPLGTGLDWQTSMSQASRFNRYSYIWHWNNPWLSIAQINQFLVLDLSAVASSGCLATVSPDIVFDCLPRPFTIKNSQFYVSTSESCTRNLLLFIENNKQIVGRSVLQTWLSSSARALWPLLDGMDRFLISIKNRSNQFSYSWNLYRDIFGNHSDQIKTR